MNHLGKMPLRFGIAMIYKAIEENREAEKWQLYVARFQHMDKNNYISFEKMFKKENKSKKIENKSNVSKETTISDIMIKVNKIKEVDNRRLVCE